MSGAMLGREAHSKQSNCLSRSSHGVLGEALAADLVKEERIVQTSESDVGGIPVCCFRPLVL